MAASAPASTAVEAVRANLARTAWVIFLSPVGPGVRAVSMEEG
jgi:hypothetical protein